MLSFYLLPSLGVLLALRWGAIDLSVWAVSGLGGVTAAGLLHLGVGFAGAMLASGLVGAGVGAIHGLCVARLRIPSPIVTLITGGAIVLAMRIALDVRTVDAPAGAFDAWLGWLPDGRLDGNSPLVLSRPFLLRLLVVAGFYLAAMGVVSAACSLSHGRTDRLPQSCGLWVVLVVSGMLAGLAGAIWLLEYGTAPVPRRPIGDLRILAAAILSGAALYRGRWRVLLAMLCLPAAVVAATLWQLEVVLPPVIGYPLQMPLLIAVTVLVQLLIAGIASGHRRGEGIGAA